MSCSSRIRQVYRPCPQLWSHQCRWSQSRTWPGRIRQRPGRCPVRRSRNLSRCCTNAAAEAGAAAITDVATTAARPKADSAIGRVLMVTPQEKWRQSLSPTVLVLVVLSRSLALSIWPYASRAWSPANLRVPPAEVGDAPPSWPRAKGVDVAEVIALYEAGRSLNQIAEKYGVRHTTIHYHLRREGVPMRPTGVHVLRMGLRPSR